MFVVHKCTCMHIFVHYYFRITLNIKYPPILAVIHTPYRILKMEFGGVDWKGNSVCMYESIV